MTENSSFIPSVNSYFISPADVILIIKKLEMLKTFLLIICQKHLIC